MNDKSSALLGTFYSIGCILSPIVGGLLTDHLGFSVCADIIALICLLWVFIFAGFYFLPDYHCKKKTFRKKNKSFESEREAFMNTGMTPDMKGSILAEKNVHFGGSVADENARTLMTPIKVKNKSFRPVSEKMELTKKSEF